jgi:ABC-type antimicrobial peptide transport system permease subunit
MGSTLVSRSLLLHLLYGIQSPYAIEIASAVLLFLVALLAIYLPARRATFVAPVQALRGGGRQ